MDDGITITIDCPIICKVYLYGIFHLLFNLLSLGLMIFAIIILFSEDIIVIVPILLIIILEFIKPIALLGYIIMRIVTKYSNKYNWYILIKVALIAISVLNIYLYIKFCQFNNQGKFIVVMFITICTLFISLISEYSFCSLLIEYQKQQKEKREKQFPNVDAPPITDQTEPILLLPFLIEIINYIISCN